MSFWVIGGSSSTLRAGSLTQPNLLNRILYT